MLTLLTYVVDIGHSPPPQNKKGEKGGRKKRRGLYSKRMPAKAAKAGLDRRPSSSFLVYIVVAFVAVCRVV